MHRMFRLMTASFAGFVILLYSLPVHAQQQPGSLSEGDSGRRGIGGFVIDEEAKIPLAGVNIVIFQHPDNNLLDVDQVAEKPSPEAFRGTASMDNGRFMIPRVPNGTYALRAQAIGYTTNIVREVVISDEQPFEDLGTIHLIPTALEMEAVELTLEREDVVLAPDRKIYRVSKSVVDAGGSASEALEEVPSVTVDVEGNVELRGNANVRILIDGKPSSRIGISGGEALQQMPAEIIERVEVLTNPGAKFEAEGDAGIINIVLKRERRKGVNGSVNVSTGLPERYGAGVNLNYRVGKFNLFANEGFNYRSHDGGGETDRIFFAEPRPYYRLYQEDDFTRSGWDNDIRVGFEYLADDHNTLTVSGWSDYGESETDSDILYQEYDGPGQLAEEVVRNDPEMEFERFYGADIGYRHTFNGANGDGHEFTADYQFEQGSEDELSEIEEAFYGGDPYLFQNVKNVQAETRHLVQADYVHPYSEDHKFELGARADVRELDHDFDVRDEDTGTGAGGINDVSNHLIYNENIYASYLSFANRFNMFSFQLGLRGEYSDITTDFEDTVEGVEPDDPNDFAGRNHREYFDLFPSVHLNYDITLVNTLQASYSRRLHRPHHWHLVPFHNFSDSRNIRRGNPNLDPEYSNQYELGWLFHTDNGSVNSSVYYRQTTGGIEWYETIEDDSVSVSQPYNLADEDTYGFEFIVSYQPIRWMNLQGSFNLFRQQKDGQFLDQNFDAEFTSWFSRLSTRFMFTPTSQIQARFFYMGPREGLQGKRDPMYMLDLGISQSLWDNRATLSLNVRDVFDTRRREYEVVTDQYITSSSFQWRGRTATLQLTWRFNPNERQKRQGEDGPPNGNFDDDMMDGGGM